MDLEETIKRQQTLQPHLDNLINSYNKSEYKTEWEMYKRIAFKVIDDTFPTKDCEYQNRGWKTYFEQVVRTRDYKKRG